MQPAARCAIQFHRRAGGGKKKLRETEGGGRGRGGDWPARRPRKPANGAASVRRRRREAGRAPERDGQRGRETRHGPGESLWADSAVPLPRALVCRCCSDAARPPVRASSQRARARVWSGPTSPPCTADSAELVLRPPADSVIMFSSVSVCWLGLPRDECSAEKCRGAARWRSGGDDCRLYWLGNALWGRAGGPVHRASETDSAGRRTEGP